MFHEKINFGYHWKGHNSTAADRILANSEFTTDTLLHIIITSRGLSVKRGRVIVHVQSSGVAAIFYHEAGSRGLNVVPACLL